MDCALSSVHAIAPDAAITFPFRCTAIHNLIYSISDLSSFFIPLVSHTSTTNMLNN